MTKPEEKPNDDPALAMCVLWQREADHLDELGRLASQRERAALDAPKAERDEAKRLYLAAERVHDQFADQLLRSTKAIFKVRARTFEGVAAKLAVAFRELAPSPDTEDEPWPYIRSVKADLDWLIASQAIKSPTNDNAREGEQ